MNAQAPILPREAYTSQKWFEKEQYLIFGNTWQFAGLEEDLKQPGDYLSVQCGHQSIMVIKDRQGQLKALHNLCRHRGTQLLRAVGKTEKVLVCPYHDWTYNLEGQLISVPGKSREFPQLQMDKVCLHRASVGVWRGIIWVHPKADAPSLENWFGGMEQYLGPHQPERLIEYPDSSYEKVVNANWKIIAENYIDVYHLNHLHSHTLKMYDHSRADFGFEGQHYHFREPLSNKYLQHLDQLSPFKRIAEMTDDLLGAYVPWFFPAAGLAETESSWSVFYLQPLAPDKTKVMVRTKLEPMTNLEYFKQSRQSERAWPALMGYGTKYNSQDKEDPFASWDFMEEDIYACEQQQKGMHNPLLEEVHYAERGERPVQWFQQMIRQWITPENTQAVLTRDEIPA